MRTASLAMLLSLTAGFALAADAPRTAPPFTIVRAGAPTLQLSQYRGKIIALTLINTECSHCQALTATVLVPLAKEFANKNVQFIECAFNPQADTLVPGFMQKFQPPFPVGWSNDAAVKAFLGYTPNDPRLAYVPHMVFLDAKGMIRDDYPAENDFFKNPETNIRAEIEKLSKPVPATSASTPAKKK